MEKAPVADGAATTAGADCTIFVRYLDCSIMYICIYAEFNFIFLLFRKEKKQEGEVGSDDDVEAPRC